MRNRIRKVLWGVAVLGIAVLVVGTLALGPLVRRAVEAAAPTLLGVPVRIERVVLQPWTGTARIDGLVMGPPEGFSANLAELGHFRMIVQVSSFWSDPIVIREIVIRDPVVTYELSGIRSNVGALLSTLDNGREPPSGRAGDSPPKKVAVEYFLFEGGKVRLATTLTGGKGVVLPLPTVELRDIGRRREGVTQLEATRRAVVAVSVAVLTTVRDGVAGVAGLGGDVISAIGSSAGAGLESAASLVGEGAKAVGTLVRDGAQTVGHAAEEGVRAVGGALRSVGGLLGGSSGKDQED